MDISNMTFREVWDFLTSNWNLFSEDDKLAVSVLMTKEDLNVNKLNSILNNYLQ